MHKGGRGVRRFAHRKNLGCEMYSLLYETCTGCSLSCTFTTDDMHCFTAWQRLYWKYKPKTPARAIQLVGCSHAYSSLGIAVEYESVLTKSSALVSTRVALADGRLTLDVGRVAVAPAATEFAFSEDVQEIDGVNVLVQCRDGKTLDNGSGKR